MSADQNNNNTNREEDTGTEVQGNVPQTWMADYPLIAYISFLPNNSEIYLANLAEE